MPFPSSTFRLPRGKNLSISRKSWRRSAIPSSPSCIRVLEACLVECLMVCPVASQVLVPPQEVDPPAQPSRRLTKPFQSYHATSIVMFTVTLCSWTLLKLFKFWKTSTSREIVAINKKGIKGSLISTSQGTDFLHGLHNLFIKLWNVSFHIFQMPWCLM